MVSVRRAMWLLVIGAAGGAAYSWWSGRRPAPAQSPAEWPPLTPSDSTRSQATSHGDPAATAATAVTAAPTAAGSPATPEPPATTAAARPGDSVGTSSVVNALVDAPEARSRSGAGASWVEPSDDGSCPLTHPIKANDNSGIFHEPGGRFYDRTKAERCYTTPAAASADGYRQAKT